MAPSRLATRERLSFAKLSEVQPLPNLIAIQRESFARFLEEGLAETLRDISPIEDFTATLSLEFDKHKFDEPKHSVAECRNEGWTYSRPLHVVARFSNKETGEIKEQTVFMGDFPVMTDDGTFVINGTERVVVSQLVRSPGVYFDVSYDKVADKDVFACKVIPARGAWLEFDVDKKDTVGVRVDRKRRQNVTILLKALGFGMDEEILSLFGGAEIIQNTLEKDHVESVEDALIDMYRKLRPGEPPTPDLALNLINGLFFNPKRYDLAKVGRYKVNQKLEHEYKALKVDMPPGDEGVLTKSDILAAVSYLVKLYANEDPTIYETDDIDHFGSRRIRSVGELIQNQVRIGLSRMERVVRERMTTQDVEAITPQTLINIRPVVAAIKEFFGTSQLSQFMDQTNPLAGVTHKRRLSALGPGGLSRERAGFDVRDVHPSHYGRMCPIETPEGPNIGLIGSLATYARINPLGFIETPYRKVKKGVVTDEVEYLTAKLEDQYVIAQASAPIDAKGRFIESRVLVRRRKGEIDYVDPSEVDYMDVSPRQIVSVATALIPFLEHDDPNRALMGANMQRQAVPLLRSEAPYIGTGVEARAARDAGEVVISEAAGTVTAVTGKEITVTDSGGKTQTYKLHKFRRSNQGTSINQRALVSEGMSVKAGDVLADGPCTDHGELALGKNLLVAFMPWEGHNYEDAIVISERLVKEDMLSSIHIEEHDVDARDTKLGAEEITADIPNVTPELLADLDERGIIRIGAEVQPGDYLVGKVTPKGETELTPEERLLQAIFGEKAREVRDTSLKVPHGESGKVIDVRVFKRDEGHDLPPGVNQLVKVYVAQKRKISDGDKLAGRHGNKGVISRILPVEDMPFLEDGTPVDILLNPLGVPSRMNLGQVLEAHLGWGARFGWTDGPDQISTDPVPGNSPPAAWISSPVFDGAREDQIVNVLETVNPGRDGDRLIGADGKAILYNGRTGEPYDHPITVGYAYILKLLHLVDDKIHARSTGPYSMITQQPLGGKAQFGGQRFGEMEVWALEAYGATYALQELLTIKSDDVHGRVKVYESIVKGENIPEPGIPESFKVLLKEMQSLCLNVDVFSASGEEIDMGEIDDEVFKAAEDLGIDISRPERGEVEEA
ncbi:MAG: DNA-directed RNA polymerase subunit beta [Acidobacteria bacterium]|nr:MAG: DNA-directed RNA polymerase subunit beta [Acidobacteriota bacterium]